MSYVTNKDLSRKKINLVKIEKFIGISLCDFVVIDFYTKTKYSGRTISDGLPLGLIRSSFPKNVFVD